MTAHVSTPKPLLAGGEDRGSRSRFEELYELLARLFACKDVGSALKEVLDASIDVVSADAGYVRLFEPAIEPSYNMFPFVVHRGLSDAYLEYFSTLERPVDPSARQAIYDGRRVTIDDMMTHPSFAPHFEIVVAEGYRSLHATPLMSRSGDRCLGNICTYFRRVHAPSPAELRMLDLYAEFAASVIEHHQQLTRLEHRHAITAQLARELIRLIDEGGPTNTSEEIASMARALATEISEPIESSEAAEPATPDDYLNQHLFGLSASEVQMLADIGQGFSEAQIAARMGISRFMLAKQLGATVRRIEAETPSEAGDYLIREMFSQTGHNRPPFSKVLRHLRLRAGLTQTELGERAGLSHRTISDLERGTRRKTYSSTVKLLAKALELSSEEASRLDASVDRSRGTTPSTPAHHDRRRTNTL